MVHLQQPLVAQPRLRDHPRALAGDARVQCAENIGREVRGNLVDRERERCAATLEHVLPHDGRYVFSRLQAPIICELDQIAGDARVGREQEGDVDLPALERLEGQRPSRIQRDELLEVEAVPLLQAEQAERPLRTLWGTAEPKPAGHMREVADRMEPVSRSGSARDDDRIAVLRGGRRQSKNLSAGEGGNERSVRRVNICACPLLPKGEEGKRRPLVLRNEVDEPA